MQHPALISALLLTGSNLFITVAWYGHLKHLQSSPWWAGLCLLAVMYFIFRN